MQMRSLSRSSFRTRSIWVFLILAMIVIADFGLGNASAQMGFGRFGGGSGHGGFGAGGFGARPRVGPSGFMSRGSDGLRRGGDIGRLARGPDRQGRFAIAPRRPRLPHLADGLPVPVRPTPPGRAISRPSLAARVVSPAATLPPKFDAPSVDESRYVPNEILVTTQARLSSVALRRFERRFGLTPLASTHVKLLGIEIRRYRLSDSSSVRGTILSLRGSPDIGSAQPNYLFTLQDANAVGRQAPAKKFDDT